MAEPTESDAQTFNTAKLTELTNAANLQYSLKRYPEAAELYSEASELQVSINGEMAPENAELLFLYGRCLYKVAISKSDVLGGQVASEKPKPKADEKPVESGSSKSKVEAKEAPKAAAKSQEPAAPNKPFFEITGDDNWDTDSDEEGEGDAQAEAVEEEDDLATAYEILDVARVLLEKQIALQELDHNGASESKGKGKAADVSSPKLRHFKERLADTHDLQAEISLENERFDDAIVDTRAALTLWQELHPQEASIIAEGHFKLSLALEFSSNVGAAGTEAEEGAEPPTKRSPEESEALKKEAILEMEAAIQSCRLRIVKEEKELASLGGEKAKELEKSIVDVKEIVVEMEQRLADLQNPTDENPMANLLKNMLGGGTEVTAAAQPIQAANDLSGLVRKKKPKVEPEASNGAAASASANGRGKRALENEEDAAAEQVDGKKAKLEV